MDKNGESMVFIKYVQNVLRGAMLSHTIRNI